MATIITKNSTGSGVTPSSLIQGELAINVVDGRLFYGSGSGNAVKEFPGLAGGTNKYIPLWDGSSSQTTSSLYQVASNQIILGATASVHTGNEEALAVYQGTTTSYNLISGHSNINSYSQLNIVNFNTGANASSDIVATADTGNESVDFIDMGINGSGYTNTGLVGSARDAYIYSTGENLLIGNASTGKEVIIFNGGTDAAANARMYIHDTNVGVIGINTDTIGDINNPAALRIVPPNNNTFNMIETEANLNGFVQNVFKNINSGVSASSDIVAQNDLGETFAYFIDMGINSSTYNQDYVGGPNDTYIIGAGEHMHIGNIGHAPGVDASLYLYTGGTTDNYTRVYISASGEVGINTLTPQYQFDVSGSGRFTNGLIVTGSFITTDSSNRKSIDTSTRQLFNSTNQAVVNFETPSLITLGGITAFEWSSDYLSTSTVYHKQESRIGTEGESLSNTTLDYSGQSFRYTGKVHGSCVPGNLVWLDTDGVWYAVDQADGRSTHILGIYLDNEMVLLEGDVTLDTIQSPNYGIPVYIKEGAISGNMTTSIPTSGYVRVIGHCYYENQTTVGQWILKFRPSNDWYRI